MSLPLTGLFASDVQLRQSIQEQRIKTDFTNTTIKDGFFEDKTLEALVQPSSFEPRIGNEAYILEAHDMGLLSPNSAATVYSVLHKYPYQKRTFDQLELKCGHTYLFPLQERVSLTADEHIKSSTKSSSGRVFLYTRLLADYNPCLNEIHGHFRKNEPLQLWLLVQPLAFDVLVQPGLTFNQLRDGYGDPKLRDFELRRETVRNALTQESNPFVYEGLQLTLDAQGQESQGLVGFRAKRNPEPINMALKDHHPIDDYFVPIEQSHGGVRIEPDALYILCSAEHLRVPTHLNAEVNTHSTIGIHGDKDFAGFIDNGFCGQLVFELRSKERTPVTLEHRRPLTRVDFFHSMPPLKVYGQGSHYAGQHGPRVAKYFSTEGYNFLKGK